MGEAVQALQLGVGNDQAFDSLLYERGHAVEKVLLGHWATIARACDSGTGTRAGAGAAGEGAQV